ncbi:NAD(P)/FAD-dependent oxidoreductase [Dinghuibacter silviterrae]|uniref:D-amino-acid dehydrogenase n=1 Tax=Dinghuibacter silviterrae TaxID=1539049 RepID=A0A4R8DSI4_9BACT|nr:FAD-dependent oxidoreductase [Dinghuibacter silviterrae]TDX01222.1 D-amino-acid dehydrogenase [Dinghuibacter silviterrae]
MKAVVIGGGITGLCSAWYLRKAGWDVTVLDRSDLKDNCSYGNLGMIVPSHFVPLAAPGMVMQGIKWMFDSSSPFYIKPSLNPALVSWGWKFMRSATREHVERSGPYLRDLNVYSKQLYETLAQEPGFDFALEKKGILMYFKTPRVAEEEIHLGIQARRMGLDVEALEPAAVQALEPGLDLDILGAVHYRCDAHLYPNRLMPQLIGALRGAGVTFELDAPVTGIERSGSRVAAVQTTRDRYTADKFVLTGGSWLPGLAAMAGVSIPLMPGKGYSFTLDNPITLLNIPAILCEARVAITPMAGKMRYGGTMEIDKVNDKIRMNRVEAIVSSVSTYFPGIRLEVPSEKDVWYGFRPCSPDGLPYIGPAKGTDNLLVAGGHSMMGLSLGPATGKVIADMAEGRMPEVAVDAFRADRFS